MHICRGEEGNVSAIGRQDRPHGAARRVPFIISGIVGLQYEIWWEMRNGFVDGELGGGEMSIEEISLYKVGLGSLRRSSSRRSVEFKRSVVRFTTKRDIPNWPIRK